MTELWFQSLIVHLQIVTSISEKVIQTIELSKFIAKTLSASQINEQNSNKATQIERSRFQKSSISQLKISLIKVKNVQRNSSQSSSFNQPQQTFSKVMKTSRDETKKSSHSSEFSSRSQTKKASSNFLNINAHSFSRSNRLSLVYQLVEYSDFLDHISNVLRQRNTVNEDDSSVSEIDDQRSIAIVSTSRKVFKVVFKASLKRETRKMKVDATEARRSNREKLISERLKSDADLDLFVQKMMRHLTLEKSRHLLTFHSVASNIRRSPWCFSRCLLRFDASLCECVYTFVEWCWCCAREEKREE